MNHSYLSKLVGASILTASLAVLPLSLPAAAQTDAPNQNNDNNGAVLDTTPLQETKGDNDNFGWLGLLGLIGLANLLRKRKEPVAYRDQNVTSNTGNRF